MNYHNTERRFTHVELLLCSLADPGEHVCHSYSYGLRAIIQCLPAWFRFIQCLRRYRDTKRAFPHLVNAGKYSTTFFVVTFAALYATHRGRRGSAAAREAQLWVWEANKPAVVPACGWRAWFGCSAMAADLEFKW